MSASLPSPSESEEQYSDTLSAILVFGTTLRLYLLFSTGATEEDFFITLRYAQNIANGHGFVYNAGAHVLGTTTPLYTLILALIMHLKLDPELGGKLLDVASDALAGLFTYRLGRAVGRPKAGLAAAFCLAFAPTNLIWATKGMEVGIVAAVGVGTWLAWVEKREIAAWIGAALMVLLRIDGVTLAVFLLAATLWRWRREGKRQVFGCSGVQVLDNPSPMDFPSSPNTMEKRTPSAEHRTPEHLNTRTPEHPNTRTPEHPNTRTPEHLNTRTPEHPNTRTPEHPNTRTPEHLNTRTPEHLNTEHLNTEYLNTRVPWRGPAVFAALLAPWLIFATLYFGSPVPLSLKAKLVVYGRLFPGRFPHLVEFLKLMLHNPLGVVCAVGVVLFIGRLVVERGRGKQQEGAYRLEWLLAAPGCWIALHYAGMAFSKVFLFGWYFVPPTPIYYLLAMLGWDPLVAGGRARLRRNVNRTKDRLLQRAEEPADTEEALPASNSSSASRQRSSVAMALLVRVVCLVCAVTMYSTVSKTLIESQAVENDLRRPIGDWLHEHAAPSDTVMLEPIGYIGYYSGLKVIDVIGLVSPEVLPYYAAEVPCPDHALWTHLHPDWLLLRAGQAQQLTRYEATLPASERLEASYIQAHAWPDNTATLHHPAGFLLFHRR